MPRRRTDLEIALDLDTDPEEIDRLSYFPEYRSAVASHPALRKDRLIFLFPNYPVEAWNNPTAKEYESRQPGFQWMEDRARLAIAMNEHTPSDVLDILANDPYYLIQSSVVSNPNALRRTIERIAASSAHGAAREVADERIIYLDMKRHIGQLSDPATELRVLEVFARMGNNEEKRIVASHPNASMDLLIELHSLGFNEEVAANPATAIYNLIEPGFIDNYYASLPF